MRRTSLLLSVLVAGCAEGPDFHITPDHATPFGEIDVTISGDLSSLGAIQSITVAGVHAWNLRPEGTGVVATLQGAPDPGDAEVIVTGQSGRAVRQNFHYDAPSLPTKWVAFGASLTQGTQSMGIDPHSQLDGVSGLVGRQAGVFLAPPLLDPRTVPPIQPSDYNPDCTLLPGAGDVVKELFAQLKDPQTGLLDLKRGRVDWTLAPRDIAIGGAKLADQLHGSHGNGALLERMVEQPDSDPGEILTPVDVSQIQRLELLDPDVAFSTDLLANDVDPAVVDPNDIRADLITPLSTAQPEMVEIASRLGKLHGQYFIANLPSLTYVPNVLAVRARRLAAGTDTDATFAAKLQAVDDATNAYNAALADAVAPYPNLHLVDLHAAVASEIGGVTIGERLTAQHLGGLLSLDDLHFTDTGYALLANVMIAAMNQQGLAVPMVDLDAAHAGDALAPSKLRQTPLAACVPPAM